MCSFLKLDTNRFLLMIKRTECLLPACLRACASVCIYVCCVCFFILSPGRALLTKEELCEPTVFSCVCFVSLSPQIALFFPPNLRSHCSLFFFWWWFVFFFFWVFLFVVCDSAAECLTSTLEAEVRVVVVTVTHFHLFSF